jgi:hypothetical protein
MTDLTAQLQTALTRAAHYECLGYLAVDDTKRVECCSFAKFYSDAADELRALLASQRKAGEM